jgi:outer membrane protein TolC
MTVTLLAVLLGAMPGPLVDYVEAGRLHNHTLAISKAQLAEQEAQVSVALATLTPIVQVQGAYTRNQYPAIVKLPSSLINSQAPTGIFQTITIQPYNQLNGTLALDIPLVNADGLTRYAQGRHGSAAALQGEKATQADVDISIVRAYYQVVAAQGVREAANRAAKVSAEALAVSQARLEAGAINKLAVDRAKVDLARAQQTIAEAERTLGIARRNLETLTGMSVPAELPGAGPPEFPVNPEDFYVETAQRQRPEVLQAREAVAQASAARDQAWMQLVPSLTGNFTENLTNASGFVGHEGYWAAGVKLNWILDPVGTPASVRKADAAMLEQEQRLKQELDVVRDDVHTSFLDIALYRARVEETAAETESAREALKLAQEQFSAGTTTSLDLSSAQRDAFQAEANYAESTANLAASILGLLQASGEPLLADAEEKKQPSSAEGK